MVKKLLSFIIITVMVFSMIPAVSVFGLGDNSALDTNKICLDPGHGCNTGADGAMQWGGLQEDHYNLTISKQCKAVLEAAGVSVVMTRTTNSYNPSFPERAQIAVNNGAGTLVSIHNNSSSSSSANGCGAFITNNNYLPNHAARSALLGDAILTRLTNDVGIRRWEMYSVNGSSTYPDGSRADYYGILRNSKTHHLNASVIIECVFQSNYSDVHNYLLNPAKVLDMGTAIANGIMDAYNIGQQKEEQYFNNIDTSPTTCLNGSELVVKINKPLIKTVDTELSISGWSVHKEGVAKYQYKLNDGAWTDMYGWFRQDVEDVVGSIYTDCKTLNAFSDMIDVSSLGIGSSNLKIRGVTKEGNEYEIAEYFLYMNPEPGAMSMSTDKTRYTLDEPIKVTATGVVEGAWVGLFGADEMPGSVSSYCWFEMHNGTVTLNDFLAEGMYNSRGEIEPGEYQLLAFVDSGYNIDPSVPAIKITLLANKHSHVDSPADETDITLEVGDNLHVAGWSVHPDGIASFELVIDGTIRTTLDKNERSDIFAAYPDYATACADLYAFAHNYSTSALSLGTHTAEIVVTTKAGDAYTLKTFSLTITPLAYEGKLTVIEGDAEIDRTSGKPVVSGLKDMLDAESVVAMFDGDCVITAADGSELKGYVGSGCIINLYFGNKIYDSAIIIVDADLDGDGIANGVDLIRAKKFMLNSEVECYSQAGDLDGDGVITDADLSLIANSCIK